MKTILKISALIMCTMLVLFVAPLSLFAANDPVTSNSSLTGYQIIGGFAVLLLVILLPLLKGSHKRERI
jgi:fumarate reductase subunit D